jgi:adenine-specific DNA-methyltransferase
MRFASAGHLIRALAMPENPLTKFQQLLRELFQFEHGDLNFGIYRIMNLRRSQMERWINEELPKRAEAALKTPAVAIGTEIVSRLTELRQKLIAIQADAIDPDGRLVKLQDTDAGKEYQEKWEQQRTAPAKTPEELESDLYNHLYAFFSRYYDRGDFIPQRRYSFARDGRDTYAVPYSGEEVILHWANKDQYYIKTGERFSRYEWQAPAQPPINVRFELTEAAVERDNQKAEQDRFYVPAPDAITWDEQTRTLTVPFQFRALTEDESAKLTAKQNAARQEELLARAQEALLKSDVVTRVPGVTTALLAPKKDAQGREVLDKDENPVPLIQHHLRRRIAENTADYFIHKDLGRFLSGELDYYIKSDVLRLDAMFAAGTLRAPAHFQLVQAVRDLGRDIIHFLAQFENFQRALFEKRKFVTKCHWCLTLGRVEEAGLLGELPELLNSADHGRKQIDEWKRLSMTQEAAAFAEPITTEFLRGQPLLVLDTALLPSSFTDRLLATFSSLDEQTYGVVIQAENFQALNLVADRYREDVTCTYADPRFNIGENADFAYKTDYESSTWLTLLLQSLLAVRSTLADDSYTFLRCDYHGIDLARAAVDAAGFDIAGHILLDRSRNEAGSPNKLEVTFENLFLGRKSELPLNKYKIPRPLSLIKWTGFLMAGDRSPPERTFLGKTLLPPAGQHFSLRQDKVTKLMREFHLRLRCGRCGALHYDCDSTEQLNRLMKRREHQFKFYDITAETTYFGTRQALKCLACGADDFRVDYLGADEVFVNDRWLDIPSYSRRWNFKTENSEQVVDRCIRFSEGTVLDPFLGSGTTAAVACKHRRHFVGIDFGEHIESTAIPRLKAVLSGDQSGISSTVDWRGGGMFKYVRLESYEDALDNIEFRDPGAAQPELSLASEYALRYALDWESRESPTRLAVEALDAPFDYTLELRRDERTEIVRPDLAETFNYLIGVVDRGAGEHRARRNAGLCERLIWLEPPTRQS